MRKPCNETKLLLWIPLLFRDLQVSVLGGLAWQNLSSACSQLKLLLHLSTILLYNYMGSPLVLDHLCPRFARCCLLPYPKKLKALWQDFQQCPPPFSAWKRWQDHNQLVQNHMTRLIVAHCGFLSGKMLVAVWLVCSRSTGDFSLLDRGSALVTCLNPSNL